MAENILALTNLKVSFAKKGQAPQEVIHGLDVQLPKGEIVGIVGESGSGKSVVMKSIMSILPDEGQVTYDAFTFANQPVTPHARLPIAMIFQDPMTALNPLRTIGYHLIEVIQRQAEVSKADATKLAIQELNKVGILLPEKRMKQYPHELSGGMRQRIMIAMALLAKPQLLIADEPTTALDVTIQAQILNLIRQLQKDEDLSVVLVTHDFGIVAGMCQSIKVMYAGQIVEEGSTEDIFYNPQHAYTQDLLRAIPTGEKGERLYSMGNQPNSVLHTGGQMVSLTATHAVLRQGGDDDSLN